MIRDCIAGEGADLILHIDDMVPFDGARCKDRCHIRSQSDAPTLVASMPPLLQNRHGASDDRGHDIVRVWVIVDHCGHMGNGRYPLNGIIEGMMGAEGGNFNKLEVAVVCVRLKTSVTSQDAILRSRTVPRTLYSRARKILAICDATKPVWPVTRIQEPWGMVVFGPVMTMMR